MAKQNQIPSSPFLFADSPVRFPARRDVSPPAPQVAGAHGVHGEEFQPPTCRAIVSARRWIDRTMDADKETNHLRETKRCADFVALRSATQIRATLWSETGFPSAFICVHRRTISPLEYFSVHSVPSSDAGGEMSVHLVVTSSLSPSRSSRFSCSILPTSRLRDFVAPQSSLVGSIRRSAE